MSLGTLGGFAVSSASVYVGAWGNYWIDATITEPETIAGKTSFVCGGVTMVCTVVSGGAFEGRAAYRLAGAPGWDKTLPAKPYRDDSGVKASSVLGDAARESGEAIDGMPTTRLGPHFARAEGAASQALNLIAPRAWRVDFDGVARFGLRTTTTYTGDAPRTRRELGGVNVIELATEDLTGLLPGVIVDGALPATDVEYSLDAKRLTAKIYAGPKTNRLLEAQRKIFDALYPNMRYAGTYEFRVVTQTGERLNLQPVRTSTGLPDLANVPVRPGMAGLKAKVLPGSLVLVSFVDRDPSRPVVVGHDAPDAPGWMPIELDLGEAPQLGIARQTDPVQAGPFGGVIVQGSIRIKAGL